MSSLDIRRIRENPYKKLERPSPEKSVFRYQVAVWLESLSGSLAVLSAFLIPAWWWDFGTNTGSVQRLVLIICLGLMAAFNVVGRVLSAKSGGKFTTAERLLVFLAILLIGGALFGGDWRTALGLNPSPANAGPYLPELILLFAWVGLIARLPHREKYAKLILASALLGSTVFGLSVLARYFVFGSHGLLTSLSAQSWPAVFSINAVLLLVFAMWQKGPARAVWAAALFIHLAAIFLFDENLSWIILAVSTTILLIAQITFSKKLQARNFAFPLQVWVISLLLLFVPVKFFTGINPIMPDAYSQPVLIEAVKNNFGPLSLLPAGPAAGGGALARSAAGETELNLETLQKSLALPALPLISNGHIQLYFQLGVIGAILWLAFWLIFLWNGYVFARGHSQSLKNQTMGEEAYWSLVVLGGAIILLVALAWTAWSGPVAWLLFTLAGLSLAWRDEAGRAKPSFWSELWERARAPFLNKKATVWLSGAGAVLAMVLYIALVFISGRIVGAERAAAGADVAEVGVRYNHWEKAAQKNPWNNFYKLKMAQSRLDVLSDGTPISEQKETFEAVNKTLLQTSASPEPVWPWLSALVYGQMEKYVEGSLKLAQDSYGRAYKLWPNNVALATQIAKFYREQTEGLVSSEVTASQLRADAKGYVKYALKLVPDYLPARLELALLIEKDGDLPGAIAELEPWENDSPEIKYHVGRLYFNDDQIDAALEKFLQVIKEVPNHSNAHYSLGVAYYRQKKYSEALAEFEKVNELNPGNEDVVAKIEEVRKKIK
ncbi:MAG: tetratricopeptide repeat protein [Patescibacteria group bacterium]